MSLLAPWLAFPAVLLALALGAGLLVERASGMRLPGALLAPLGFCALVVATQLTTASGAIAELSMPLCVVLAVAGFALGARRLRAAPLDLWAIAAAAVTFVTFSAPAVLTGERTFLGYSSLGDASVHFSLVDRVMEHGRSLAGLPESSYRSVLENYTTSAYPTGAHTVLGAAREIVGIDVAWVFQPYLAVLAALVTLALLPLARELTSRPALATGAAVLATQPGLVYAYAQQQEALKELATIVVLVTLVGLAVALIAAGPAPRVVVPLVVASAAGLGILSVAVAPWLGTLLLAVLVLLVARRGRDGVRGIAVMAGAFAAALVVLSVPAIVRAADFTSVSSHVLTSVQELGNLVRPLNFVQVFGVWPRGDFRLELTRGADLEYALIGVAAVAALFGLIWLVRRRLTGPLLLVLVSAAGFLAVARIASPWAYGKALMVLSPAVMLVAAAGVISMWESRRRPEALVLAAALVIGVVWTNALTYRYVDAAPHDRLAELERLGPELAGEGPLIYTEFEEYGKHFLRQAAPVGASEGFRPAWMVPRPGTMGSRFGFSSDLDELELAAVQRARVILLRRSPAASRPPAGWTRASRGTYYDVWRRDADAPEVLEHLPLGGDASAAAPADCAQVERLAGVARDAGGRLVAAPRAVPIRFETADHDVPENWGRDGSDPDVLRPIGAGRIDGDVTLPAAGTWHIWLEGSFGRAVSVAVDGQPAGTVEDELSPRGQAYELAPRDLAAGAHRVTVSRGGPDLDPRDGSLNRFVGPVTFTQEADPGMAPLRTVSPDRWRSLCEGTYDWLEVVR